MKKFLLIFVLSALAVESTIATNQMIQKKLAETIKGPDENNNPDYQPLDPNHVVTTTSTTTPVSTKTAQDTHGASNSNENKPILKSLNSRINPIPNGETRGYNLRFPHLSKK